MITRSEIVHRLASSLCCACVQTNFENRNQEKRKHSIKVSIPLSRIYLAGILMDDTSNQDTGVVGDTTQYDEDELLRSPSPKGREPMVTGKKNKKSAKPKGSAAAKRKNPPRSARHEIAPKVPQTVKGGKTKKSKVTNSKNSPRTQPTPPPSPSPSSDLVNNSDSGNVSAGMETMADVLMDVLKTENAKMRDEFTQLGNRMQEDILAQVKSYVDTKVHHTPSGSWESPYNEVRPLFPVAQQSLVNPAGHNREQVAPVVPNAQNSVAHSAGQSRDERAALLSAQAVVQPPLPLGVSNGAQNRAFQPIVASGNPSLFGFTSTPLSKVVLGNKIKYDTWRNFLMTALRSANLMYLIDETVAPPYPVASDPDMLRSHKARFCEIVAERLLPADLNKISHITEPIELILKLDQNKLPPFHSKGDEAHTELVNMRYLSTKVNPYNFLNLFEKKVEDCRVFGVAPSERWVSNRFIEAVKSTLPEIISHAMSYKSNHPEQTFVPYNNLRTFFLGVAVQRRNSSTQHSTNTAFTSVINDASTGGKKAQKRPSNPTISSSGPCVRCPGAGHSNAECQMKTCPVCKTKPVNAEHIKSCSAERYQFKQRLLAAQQKPRSSSRGGRSSRARGGRGATRGRTMARNQGRKEMESDSRSNMSKKTTSNHNVELTAQYVRIVDGLAEPCGAEDDGAIEMRGKILSLRTKSSSASVLKTCLDSGCNHELFRSTDHLTNVNRVAKPIQIIDANQDDNGLTVREYGKLSIQMDNRMIRTFDRVHISPKVVENLLSVRQFTKTDNPVVFFDDVVYVARANSISRNKIKNQAILTGYSENGLWYIDLKPKASNDLTSHLAKEHKVPTTLPENQDEERLSFDDVKDEFDLSKYLANVPECSIEDLKSLSEQEIRSIKGQLGKLWHYRLCHPNAQLLRKLTRLIPELDGVHIPASVDECFACKTAKAKKLPHSSERRRASKPLDLIHTDVSGPILPSAYPDGEQYFLGIVDDYTRLGFIYPMKSKSEVHLGLQAFFEMIDRTVDFPYRTRFIRMDNGTEYKTDEVKKFLRKKGIVEDLSPPHTSPLNGVAERFLQTIQNATRSILSDSGLPKRMWLFAARYTLTSYNILPREACGDQTPYELMYRRKPAYKFLRRFGCVAHLTLPKKVGKFSDRAQRKFFLGLTNNGALLLDVASGSVKVGANVTYTESQVYGHHYGPFENTKFRDPIRLKRSAMKWFDNEIETPADAPLHVGVPPRKTRQRDPTSDLDSYLQLQFENEAARTNRDLRCYSNFLVEEYPNLPELPVLQTTVQDYVPLRVDATQPLPNKSRKYRSLRCRHYIETSIDSHIKSNALDENNDPQSSKFDDPQMTEEKFLSLMSYDTFDEPQSYNEAVQSPNFKEWQKATKEELDSMKFNNTWVEISLSEVPKGVRLIDAKWIYKLKINPDGTLRYRARLVARGFLDSNSYDIMEVYAPVADINDIRTILAYANKKGMQILQLDIKVAFLNGVLEKPVYMRIPQGLGDASRRKTHVLELRRSLYGLKVSPKRWFEKFRTVVGQMGFKPFALKPCIFKWKYTKNGVSKEVILIMYVDDLLVIGDSSDKINEVVTRLEEEFQVTNLGSPQKYLGIDFKRDFEKRTLFLTQESYATKLLQKYGYTAESKSKPTPMLTLDAQRKRKRSPDVEELPTPTVFRSIIGSLIFLANSTRPDITHSVNMVSRAQANPSPSDWEAIFHILEYLVGTKERGLLYKGLTEDVTCYSDASLGSNDARARSTSGYVVYAFGDLVSWRSKRQTHVALSSAEAEYIAASLACRQIVSVKSVLQFVSSFNRIPILYEDNKATIHLAKSLEQKSLKHIVHLCFHHIRFEVVNRNLDIKYVPSKQNVADLFTKALPQPLFEKFRDELVSKLPE